MEQNNGTSPEGQKPLETVVTTNKKVTKTYPYHESNKIIIKPATQKPVLPESGTLHNSAETYVQRIGSAWAAPGSPLQLGRIIFSLEEEKELMPQVIGVTPSSENWEKALNDFWKNLSIPVDMAGLVLETGYIHLSADKKIPISPYEFVIARYCEKYAAVAKNKADIFKSKKIRFYMEKPEEERKKRAEFQNAKDQATVLRLEIQKDKNKVRSIIRVLDLQHPHDDYEAIAIIADYSQQNPLKFIETCNDPDLILKGLIQTMISRGILNKPIGSTVIINGTEPIASNLNEAVAWFKNDKNAVEVATLQAKLRKQD